jgi:hypothetical protein
MRHATMGVKLDENLRLQSARFDVAGTARLPGIYAPLRDGKEFVLGMLALALRPTGRHIALQRCVPTSGAR